MHFPKVCPVCGTAPVEQLPGTVQATAAVVDNGHSREFRQMSAFRCAQQGHVFFIAEDSAQ